MEHEDGITQTVLLQVAPLTQPHNRAVRSAVMADPLQFCVPIASSLWLFTAQFARFSAIPSAFLNGIASFNQHSFVEDR
jgi:phage gp16-like protein